MPVEVNTPLEEEQFPQLPIRKQEECISISRRSSISSNSSFSVGSDSSQQAGRQTVSDAWTVTIGDEAVCRRSLFCKCKECVRRQPGALSKRKWNNLSKCPCEEAVLLERGDTAKLVSERNYGKKGEVMVFVVATQKREKRVVTWVCRYTGKKVTQKRKPHWGCKKWDAKFETKTLTTTVEGWVHSDNLGGLQAVRQALQQKEIAKNLKALRKNFGNASSNRCKRKPVPAFAPETVRPAPQRFQSKYQFSELVLARDALGHPWYQAEVASLNPLKLKSYNWDGVQVFDERNVKKHPSTKFIVVQNKMNVRTQEHGSFVKTSVPKGTVLDVVQMRGFNARITSPVVGWVQMRTMSKLNAVEQDYTPKKRAPTLFIGGLPLDTTPLDVAVALQRVDGAVVPSRTNLFRSGASLCAQVNLIRSTSFKKVAGKQIVVKGQTASCEYCLEYLRSQAVREFGLEDFMLMAHRRTLKH